MKIKYNAEKDQVKVKMTLNQFQMLEAICMHIRLGRTEGTETLADFAYEILDSAENLDLSGGYELEFSHEMEFQSNGTYRIDTTIEGVKKEN